MATILPFLTVTPPTGQERLDDLALSAQVGVGDGVLAPDATAGLARVGAAEPQPGLLDGVVRLVQRASTR
jgi:hypothetical protein